MSENASETGDMAAFRQGVFIVLTFTLLSFAGGLIWSFTHQTGISLVSHLNNGWVTVGQAMLLSFGLAGTSLFFLAHDLWSHSGRWRFLGALVTMVVVWLCLWVTEDMEYQTLSKGQGGATQLERLYATS